MAITSTETEIVATGRKKVSSPECKQHIQPVHDALDILHGKWKLLILMSLAEGPMRFKEIQREVEGITAKMLSKELKDLEMNELVQRTVYDTIPVAVEYSRTAYGASLKKVIDELHSWGLQHRKRLMRRN
jgi:DNA-binding HxlR family transcriptional regulator